VTDIPQAIHTEAVRPWIQRVPIAWMFDCRAVWVADAVLECTYGVAREATCDNCCTDSTLYHF
jgi:hypothetical protein